MHSPYSATATGSPTMSTHYRNPNGCSAHIVGGAGAMSLGMMAPQALPSPTRSGRRQSPRPLILSPSGNTNSYSSTTSAARLNAAPYPTIQTQSQALPRALGGRRHSATASQVAPSLTTVPTSAPLVPGATWLVTPMPAHAYPAPSHSHAHSAISASHGTLWSPTSFSTSSLPSLTSGSSVDTLSQLPTPTSPAVSSSLGGSRETCSPTPPSAKHLYSHNEETGMLTCHACAKVMPLSRRPRGSPCLQYTIRYHEQTTQHSICAAGFFLWHHRPAASRPTSYSPPPNLARYSGNLTLTALECLVYNPLYSVTRAPTGEKVITCHVCNQHFGGTSPCGVPESTPSSGTPPGMDLVSATVAHESSQKHERAIFACAMRLVRRWGRLVVHQPSGHVQDVVISDKEREWFAERVAATALVEIRPRAASNASLHSPPAHAVPQPQAAAEGSLMSPTFLDAAAGIALQHPSGRSAASQSPAAEELTPLLGVQGHTHQPLRPFPPPVAPGRDGAWNRTGPMVALSTSPPLGATGRIRVADLLN